MPYTDKEKAKEYWRDKKRRQRMSNPKMSNPETPKNVQPEIVPASYIYGNKGKYEFLPERPRFLTLSDGQILDRLNQPDPIGTLSGMSASNDFTVTGHSAGLLESIVDPTKRKKLEKIYTSLKNRGLQREVRYGVYGPDFETVGEMLEVTK